MPLGYLVAVTFQLVNFLGVLEIFLTFLIIYIDVCQFAITLADDIEYRFGVFSQDISQCHGTFSIKQQIALYDRLCEIIEFHSNAVQLSENWYSKHFLSQNNEFS